MDSCGHDTPVKKRKITPETNSMELPDLKICNNDSDAKDLHKQIKSDEDCLVKKEGEFNEKKVDEKSHDNSTLPELPATPENLNGMSSPSSSSEASESDWQPSTNGAIDWIQSQMLDGKDPREIIYKLVPSVVSIPSHVDNWAVWRLLVRLLSEPPHRAKLPHINTFDDVIRLIKSSKKILILTGAGVSVSCGIPDFRSRDGIYARLAVDYPDLPNPEAMFDISYFKHDPRPFFTFAKEIFPGQYKPSRIHRFINLLEKTDRLLRNYTQNIDTLEQVAGITKVIQCHGSFATASCQVCKNQVDCDVIREDIFNQVVPHCTRCPSDDPGILKPDIVFFGENLPEHFHRQMTSDKDEADLLIVIGSALKVRPVALIPNSISKEVPQILINREPLAHKSFDVELLGDGDLIIEEICRRLGEEFDVLCENTDGLSEIDKLPESTCNENSSLVSTDDEKMLEKNEDGLCEKTEKLINFCESDNSCMSTETTNENINVNEKSQSVDESSSTIDCARDSKSDSTMDAVKTKDDKIDNLSGLWKSRWKQAISRRLPEGTYYYDGGHRYIFPGAEVAPEEDSDCSSDESEDTDSSSDEEMPIGPGGLSPIRRHLHPYRSNSANRMSELATSSMTSSDDDITSAFLHHTSCSESTKQIDNESDIQCCSSAKS